MLTQEDIEMLENLCKFMINWAEKDPDGILPDPLNLDNETLAEVNDVAQ